jgi:replicative DNA helicase
MVAGGDKGWLDRVADTDLADPHLRLVLAAVRRLHASHHPVNAETVNAELARTRELTEPVRARMRDIATAGTATAASYYGEQVVIESRTRRAISHAEALAVSTSTDEIDRHYRRLAEVMQEQAGGLLVEVISAADLGRMDFPELVEHVPHLVTEGFGLLAAPPKVGKTWLACGLALARPGRVRTGRDQRGPARRAHAGP